MSGACFGGLGLGVEGGWLEHVVGGRDGFGACGAVGYWATVLLKQTFLITEISVSAQTKRRNLTCVYLGCCYHFTAHNGMSGH